MMLPLNACTSAPGRPQALRVAPASCAPRLLGVSRCCLSACGSPRVHNGPGAASCTRRRRRHSCTGTCLRSWLLMEPWPLATVRGSTASCSASPHYWGQLAGAACPRPLPARGRTLPRLGPPFHVPTAIACGQCRQQERQQAAASPVRSSHASHRRPLSLPPLARAAVAASGAASLSAAARRRARRPG
jgi:hypothetical protein